MKIPFNELSKESQFLKAALPMWAPVCINPDQETPEMIFKRHQKFSQLDELIKDKLASIETAKKIYSIGETFKLGLLQTASIARAVRNYYFGEIKLEDFPKVFSQEMGIDSVTAQKITDAAIQRVINDNSQEKKYQSKLENLILSEALKKYPELGEQLITSSHIKLQNFPDPVRPSVKNWLFDYTFNMGHEAHNSMARGSYLFQNENARRLIASDRQKLAFILKAYDENAAVTVNLTTKQIVFAKASEQRSVNNEQRTANSEQKTTNNFRNSGLTQYNPYENRQHISQAPNIQNPRIPSAKLNFTPAPKSSVRQFTGEAGEPLVRGFTSPQKMPFESQPRGPQPIRIIPHDNLNRSVKPSPKNVVNLKE